MSGMKIEERFYTADPVQQSSAGVLADGLSRNGFTIPTRVSNATLRSESLKTCLWR